MSQVLPGFRAYTRPPADLADACSRLVKISPTDLSDAQFGVAAIDADIRPLSPRQQRVAGPALTVTTSPGNGFMIRRAVELIRPGDIMVVNSFGNKERAVLGANVAREMRARGLIAVVVDGVIRDWSVIEQFGLAIFARGTTPRSGSDKNGRGEVNAPVSCGGVVVMPNDIIVADTDGITVVPQPDWGLVASRAEQTGRDKPDLKSAISTMVGSAADDALVASLSAMGLVEVEEAWIQHRAGSEMTGRHP
jgi:4-hydroxy-4-methyl-2-oxoglutarate aldolase